MRAELVPVWGQVAQMDFPVSNIEDTGLREAVSLVAAVFRTHLGKFTVKMENLRTAGTLMKIINILRNDIDIILVLLS